MELTRYRTNWLTSAVNQLAGTPWVSSLNIYDRRIHTAALSEHMLPVSASFGVVFIAVSYIHI